MPAQDEYRVELEPSDVDALNNNIERAIGLPGYDRSIEQLIGRFAIGTTMVLASDKLPFLDPQLRGALMSDFYRVAVLASRLAVLTQQTDRSESVDARSVLMTMNLFMERVIGIDPDDHDEELFS